MMKEADLQPPDLDRKTGRPLKSTDPSRRRPAEELSRRPLQQLLLNLPLNQRQNRVNAKESLKSEKRQLTAVETR